VSIFVSIAAYRDRELGPTIRDALAKARDPRALRFGVCWQHAPDEPRPAELKDRRVRVIDVPWNKSRGACWARAELMKLWRTETFFLQLDSHHRFAPDWDAKLIDAAERTGAARPILTTYGAAYDPDAAQTPPGHPTHIVLTHFMEDGIPMFEMRPIPEPQDLTRPPRARFLSAHLLFAPGSFVRDVPYDPELYFLGEEISLAVRAFTHGYDLFHPDQHILWHEPTRRYRAKHWDDHVKARGVALDWTERDGPSRAKVRRFLESPHVGTFGCGEARTFGDYEAYVGLDFRRRTARPETLRGDEPPDPGVVTETRYAHVVMSIPRDALPPAALDGPRFWYVAVHDATGAEIHRHDAVGAELRGLLAAEGPAIQVGRAFVSNRRPASWTVWPVSRDGAWLTPVRGAAG
jgi:hypothetical protein